MIDMTPFIESKSDQLNADDLIGEEKKLLKITDVKASQTEQPVSIFYEGCNGKPWKPCKTMRRVLVHCWGRDAKAYVGRSLTVYRDPDVIYAGVKVGGIRIEAMSHIKTEQVVAVAENNKKKMVLKIKVLSVEPEPPPIDLAPLLQEGKVSAEQGMDAWTAWGKSLTPEQRTALKPYLAEQKAIAEKAGEVKEKRVENVEVPDQDLEMDFE